MRLAAEKYQKEYEKQNAKALEEILKDRAEAIKKGGKERRKIVTKAMRKDLAAPLLAVKRLSPGPDGQPTGSLATSPTEADDIVRNKWAAIYKGNVEDPQQLVDSFMAGIAHSIDRSASSTFSRPPNT